MSIIIFGNIYAASRKSHFKLKESTQKNLLIITAANKYLLMLRKIFTTFDLFALLSEIHILRQFHQTFIMHIVNHKVASKVCDSILMDFGFWLNANFS